MKDFDFSNFDQNQFEGVDRFEQNSTMQKFLADRVLSFLPDKGRQSQLDFFFYTNSQGKAEALSEELKKLNYDFEIRLRNDQWSIIGCTDEIKLTDESIQKWVESMNEIGYKNDCHFDGWGCGRSEY